MLNVKGPCEEIGPVLTRAWIESHGDNRLTRVFHFKTNLCSMQYGNFRAQNFCYSAGQQLQLVNRFAAIGKCRSVNIVGGFVLL